MDFRRLAGLLYLTLAVVQPGLALDHRCAGRDEIVVAAENLETAEDLCMGAQSAVDILARYGLSPKRPVRIDVVDSVLNTEGYDAYGSYDSRFDRVELMSYRAILALPGQPQMYDEPFDRVHYRGAAAHEVAHAVMQHNLQTELISPAPQEYLAHAVQLAALPAARRERIVQAMGVGPWESGDAISDIYMAMQPGKFAVKSYLHLTGSEDPAAFIGILLRANWLYVYVP